MTKKEELENPNSCINKTADNESIFVLRSQDLLAPTLVRLWADRAASAGCPTDKVEEARRLADAMDQWPNRRYPN